MGFANSGHERNAQNRRTQKEVNLGRFKKVFGSKHRQLTDDELEQRKISSNYNKINDIPSSLIFIIISAIALIVWLVY